MYTSLQMTTNANLILFLQTCVPISHHSMQPSAVRTIYVLQRYNINNTCELLASIFSVLSE
jgi:hypothetical protein